MRIAQSKRFVLLGASLPKIRNSRLLKHHASLKNRRWTKSQKRRLSVKFSCALFHLLDFVTLEDGTDRSSRNNGKELPLNNAEYLRRAKISQDYLVMQALVWLRVVQFGEARVGPSYANLRRPHTFKRPI